MQKLSYKQMSEINGRGIEFPEFIIGIFQASGIVAICYFFIKFVVLKKLKR
jgi:hypothetical protein